MAEPIKAAVPDRIPRRTRWFRPGVPRSLRQADPVTEPSFAPSEDPPPGDRASLIVLL